MMPLVETTRFTRGKLPHWEVAGGRYFVTVRTADSLPREVIHRLRAVHEKLSATPPRSPQFAAMQRQYFVTLEKHLDAGCGACRLENPAAAQTVIAEFEALAEWHVSIRHYSIMPNHWHALIEPQAHCGNRWRKSFVA